MVLLGLLPAMLVAAFLTMAWIRSRQGTGAEVQASEIESLAVHREPTDLLGDARSRGRLVYQHYCQICHGENGKGDGFNASRLDPPPRDFSNAQLWQGTSDERFSYAIAQGGPSVGKSVLMPAWGHTLTKEQIRDVVAFLRSFASPPKAQKP
jgi:cytochrome c oxidase cbb3-type subunit 3